VDRRGAICFMMRRVGARAATQTSAARHDDPATPEAIAALCAHPRFGDAMRASAAGLVALYQGSHLLNWLMDDRGRMLFGYFALYLDVTYDPADAASGLNPTRLRVMMSEHGICSPGRALAMLSLMRFGGYVAPALQVADRRQRRLVATGKLVTLLAERWRIHFAAMAPLFADGPATLVALDEPRVARALIVTMAERFLAGFRPMMHAPQLGLFGERNAGLMICCSLLSAGEAGDAVPPSRPVPVSVAGLARRFAVSRPHVLKLLRDAEAQGLIARSGDGVAIAPALADGARAFFATLYLFFATCAREAMAATGQGQRAG